MGHFLTAQTREQEVHNASSAVYRSNPLQVGEAIGVGLSPGCTLESIGALKTPDAQATTETNEVGISRVGT